jgi:hypothetical protein
LPILALVLHDWHAYGEVHLLTMFSSQNDPQHKPALMAMHNLIAGVAMLGGAGVLPILVWRQETIVGGLLGAGIGLNAAFFSGQSAAQAVPTVLFTAAGVAALSLAVSPRVREPGLSAWALGGASFFLFVRFAATRYWAAFAPGVALLALRNAGQRTGLLIAGIAVNVLVSLGISIDDQNFARCCRDAAHQVSASGTGTFSGHWGWQHYLEEEGWRPIERDGDPGRLYAFARVSDPQLPDRSVCLQLIERFKMADQWWGPRVHSLYLQASYHAGGLGSYAPWTLSDEPYEVISVYHRCDDPAGDEVPFATSESR